MAERKLGQIQCAGPPIAQRQGRHAALGEAHYPSIPAPRAYAPSDVVVECFVSFVQCPWSPPAVSTPPLRNGKIRRGA